MTLALLYWLHMLATVLWLGGLAVLALLVLPAARRHLPLSAQPDFFLALQQRLDRLGWAALAVLLATGMFQMSANPYYEGLLAITNAWARAILFKHLAFAVMVGVSAWQTWFVLPELARQSLALSRGRGDPVRWQQLARRQERLLRLNMALAALVLALTALARAA